MNGRAPALAAVAVVVPAADEAARIGGCLEAVAAAAAQLAAAGGPRVAVRVVVVLDGCRDATAAVVAAAARRGGPPVETVAVAARRVGVARREGTRRAVARAGVPLDRLWLAHTDADSRVPVDWLVGMRRLADAGHDVVVGTVVPGPGLRPAVAQAWHRAHHLVDGHGHVHGANLGVRADVDDRLGGWAPLASGEDVELVRRAAADPAVTVHRTAALPVVTSPRLTGRAPGGFADHLRRLQPTAAPTS